MNKKQELDQGTAGCFAIFFSLSIMGNLVGMSGSFATILGNQSDIFLAWFQVCLAILSYIFLASAIQGVLEKGFIN
jgi:hypothetical protein